MKMAWGASLNAAYIWYQQTVVAIYIAHNNGVEKPQQLVCLTMK